MGYKGELIALSVAVSWTICAMFAELASKRLGAMTVNILRMTMSLLFLMMIMLGTTGSALPMYADTQTWIWLSLSGLVGYVLGDFCLFNSYILIGSRYGQLLMTLAPPAAAIFGFLLLGETMSWLAIIGMMVTMLGIGLSVLKGDKTEQSTKRLHTELPLKGILLGIGAGMGQGVGLVLSAKGMDCYLESIAANGMSGSAVESLLPFTSTAIRAITGLVGFTVWGAVRGELVQLKTAVRDVRGMAYALCATITGPFIGVSLSLMATLYTSTGIAQTIMAMTPVLIIWPSYFFFHQSVTMREILGAVIAVLGVALFFV